MTQKEKATWFDTLSEVLSLGFDLDRNSARDLLGCVNEFIRLRQEEKAQAKGAN